MYKYWFNCLLVQLPPNSHALLLAKQYIHFKHCSTLICTRFPVNLSCTVVNISIHVTTVHKISLLQNIYYYRIFIQNIVDKIPYNNIHRLMTELFSDYLRRYNFQKQQ